MLPDLSTLDAAALKALVLEQHARLLSRETEIENLKLLIFKLRHMQFGRKSEKLGQQIVQLELRLEDLESGQAENAHLHNEVPPADAATQPAKRKPVRRPLPEHLPRETQTHAPQHTACPECGGALRQFGEDVAEILEYVPAQFKVIRQVRPKLACACCDTIVQAPAPSRPIERGLAGPGLLAHVLVSKYADYVGLPVML